LRYKITKIKRNHQIRNSTASSHWTLTNPLDTFTIKIIVSFNNHMFQPQFLLEFHYRCSNFRGKLDNTIWRTLGHNWRCSCDCSVVNWG
jgi:hypothetical protein